MVLFVPYVQMELISPLGVQDVERRLAAEVQPRPLYRGAFFNRIGKSNKTFEHLFAHYYRRDS